VNPCAGAFSRANPRGSSQLRKAIPEPGALSRPACPDTFFLYPSITRRRSSGRGRTVGAGSGDRVRRQRQLDRVPVIKGAWYSGSGSVDVNTTFLTDTGTSVGSAVTLTSGSRSETVRIAGEVFANDTSDADVFMSGSDLARIDPGQAPSEYYATALSIKLDPPGALAANIGGIQVTPNDNGQLIAVVTLIALLTILLVVVAGLGVLNTVVLQLRERVHDLGVFKSVGMTPRQVIAMVVCSVTLIGLLAGIVGVPLGVLVHNGVVPVMGNAANTDLPSAVISVYSWWEYVLLALAGLVIAVVAALGPAGWAARTRTAFALRAE